ncbi:ABC transporter ATP-binding protein [Sphaerimonospora mesophila]|uniref:ABC transporter ATP-binding protein n=1 Tax=Sphaerimonospora mesophila TaxID=37483 RepID=UPI001F3B5780
MGQVVPYKGMLVLGSALTLMGSFAGLAMPMLTKSTIDLFGQGGASGGPILWLSAAVVIGALMSAAGRFLLERMGEGVVLTSRIDLVNRIMRLRVRDVDQFKAGDLLTRVSSDTTLLRSVCTEAFAGTASAVFMFLGALAMMAITDAPLLLVTLGVVVLVGLMVALVGPKIRRASLRAQVALGRMNSTLERVLQALRTVKASGAEGREIAIVSTAASDARNQGVAAIAWKSTAGIGAWTLIQLAFLAVLGVGGARVADGSMTVSALIAFLLYLFYLVSPIGQLISSYTLMQQGLAAVARIDEIRRLPSESSMDFPGVDGEPLGVIFDNVTFRYADNRTLVHDGVSFVAPAGGMTALVGPSGVGKSTVFSLVERFYEPQAGVITIGGRNIRDWCLGELRASLGYVEQDSPVLEGTFRENLTYANPEATDDDIQQVLTKTRLNDVVDRLPQGLETPVGNRGVMLSGGERQRIAIARALLRKPRLLLLDEATSQLDAVNEMRLREVIAEVARDTTVLVVAHRLSTVIGADRIIVMESGRVRGAGNHQELMASDELYRELATTQLIPVV